MPHRFQISHDSQALNITVVTKNRLPIFKKGEIILQYSGNSPIDFAFFKYGKGVRALAIADFPRTKSAADRFHRNELRLMARLLIIQSLRRTEKQGVIRE